MRFRILASAFLTLMMSAGAAMAAPPAIQIPEPSSLALIAAGAAAVAWAKFRRRG